MEINDELMACYIDGTATPEECVMVREYLLKHPEEYKDMLFLMDEDCELHCSEAELDVMCKPEYLKDLHQYEVPMNCFGTKAIKKKAFCKSVYAYNGVKGVKSAKKQLSDKKQGDNGFFSRLSQMIDDVNNL